MLDGTLTTAADLAATAPLMPWPPRLSWPRAAVAAKLARQKPSPLNSLGRAADRPRDLMYIATAALAAAALAAARRALALLRRLAAAAVLLLAALVAAALAAGRRAGRGGFGVGALRREAGLRERLGELGDDELLVCARGEGAWWSERARRRDAACALTRARRRRAGSGVGSARRAAYWNSPAPR